MSLIRKEKKKKYSLMDLNSRDMEMLSLAANNVSERYWFCYGMSFYKLNDLGLVDDDNMVTLEGRQLLKRVQ